MFKSIKMSAVALALSVAGYALACGINEGGFVPENDLYIPANMKGINGGLSKEQFDAVIDKVETLYAPIVATKGGKLQVVRKWDDGTVNAYALQTGKTWEVDMFGGLARHETITEDGFALVVCHEIGHHIGGAPKKGGTPSSGGWWGGSSGGTSSWATNEGGADYFATLKCLRNVFLNDNNAKIVKDLNPPKTLVDACKKAYKSDKADSDICIRGGMAGKSVAGLFAALRKIPEAQFDTPDTKVVTRTDDNHPQPQCRLDTYFQGAICDAAVNEDVSNTDENKGVCSLSNGHKIGNRPLCWFKPSK